MGSNSGADACFYGHIGLTDDAKLGSLNLVGQNVSPVGGWLGAVWEHFEDSV